jgi:hypothetical protein
MKRQVIRRPPLYLRPAASPACARIEISGYGIAGRSTGGLPEPWLSLLMYRRREKPKRASVLGWAVKAIELPDLDGARITVLTLPNSERGQFLHLLASGTTQEYTCAVRHDSQPHAGLLATRPQRLLAHRAWKDRPPARYRRLPAVVEGPAPLDHGTPWLEVVAKGNRLRSGPGYRSTSERCHSGLCVLCA